MPEVTFCQTETEFEISYSFNPREDISLDIFGRRITTQTKKKKKRRKILELISGIRMRNEDEEEEEDRLGLMRQLVSPTGVRRRQQ